MYFAVFSDLGFLSWTLTINKRVRGRDWKNIFIYLFQLCLLTNIPIFFCSFAAEMATFQFQLERLLQTRLLQPGCYSMRITYPLRISIWLICWLYLLDIIRLSLRSNEFESVQLLQTTPIYLTRMVSFFGVNIHRAS